MTWCLALKFCSVGTVLEGCAVELQKLNCDDTVPGYLPIHDTQMGPNARAFGLLVAKAFAWRVPLAQSRMN